MRSRGEMDIIFAFEANVGGSSPSGSIATEFRRRSECEGRERTFVVSETGRKLPVAVSRESFREYHSAKASRYKH